MTPKLYFSEFFFISIDQSFHNYIFFKFFGGFR